MGYIHEPATGASLGFFGCGPTCSCGPCSGRTNRLGEWYIRQEPEDDEEEEERKPPLRRPAPGSRLAGYLGQVPPTAPAAEIIGGFAFDRTEVPGPEHAKLIRVARVILAGNRGPFRLVGHTDPVGTDAYNLDLGRRRAEEVRRQLNITLERMRPGSSRGVQYSVDTAGERRPIAPHTTEAGRAQNRRVEIFFPSAPPPPACAHNIRNAFAIEREAARQTLGLSARVAAGFLRTVGAVGARGRFVPTIIDNKYFFAKLYEFITYEEIAEAPRFAHPAFVMHFIPIFYGLYHRALEDFQNNRQSSIHRLWMTHFTTSARPDNSSVSAWMNGVRNSIVTGVTAHVQGDMAEALVRTYQSYVAKYCLRPPPRLDEFRPDFFDRNRIVFERARASFFLDLSRFSPSPLGPEWNQFLFAQGQAVVGGLDVAEVFRWREAAWAEARRRLGQ